jgi:hypothetical protein
MGGGSLVSLRRNSFISAGVCVRAQEREREGGGGERARAREGGRERETAVKKRFSVLRLSLLVVMVHPRATCRVVE